MAVKTITMANNALATADLLDAIKNLDTIECGEEARKHFNFAPSYRNLNHGMLSVVHIPFGKKINFGLYVLTIP